VKYEYYQAVLLMVRSGDHLDGFSLLAAAAGVVLTNGRAQSWARLMELLIYTN